MTLGGFLLLAAVVLFWSATLLGVCWHGKDTETGRQEDVQQEEERE